MIFWWQGRGFLTLLLVAAPVNWLVGVRLNAKRRGYAPPATLLRRFSYRAPHKFMSLPMESWSIVMVIAAAAFALQSVLVG